MYFMISFATGALILIQTMLNAELGKRRGPIPSAFINFKVATIGLIAIIATLSLSGTVPEVNGTIPVWAWIVCPLAIGITIASNDVIPRMSAVRSTLLVFLGQLISGLVIDAVSGLSVKPKSVIGLALVVSGVIIDILAAKRRVASSIAGRILPTDPLAMHAVITPKDGH